MDDNPFSMPHLFKNGFLKTENFCHKNDRERKTEKPPNRMNLHLFNEAQNL